MILSAVILTKNEEENIVDCLESVSFCDEIIIIDDNSEDRTREVAKKMGAQIFVRSLNNDFSGQRNYGLSKASRGWVLFVDADERITKELKEEIIPVIHNSVDIRGFYIQRKDSMWGKILKHGEVGNIRLLRLARKDSGEWVGKVHESWKIHGRTSSLKNEIVHFPHENMSLFLREINFYTTIRSKELHQSLVKVSWYDIVMYPLAKFVLNYFLRLGILDGIQGLIFAILMSFHSFLVRGKLWQLRNKA